MEEIIRLLILGAVAGFVASQIVQTGSRKSWLDYIIIGVVGSIVGKYIFETIGFQAKSPLATFIMATVGAIFALYLFSFFKRRK
jgi:uncharacterized membrane protein YeaQ/YmgE (transglycosylase-associated protein family)